MIADRSGLTWQSSDGLLVLHAVRLAGFADTEAVADRVDLPSNIVGDTLRVLDGQKLIERMAFGESSGWTITEAGKSRDGELLREELEASGVQPDLQATVDRFETGINSRLVQVITEWQLHPSTDRVQVLRELTGLADALSALMAELVARLPRFGRYPRQFSAALETARTGDDRWVAGVGRLSCHLVWAELHQDLLSSLGRDRSADPRQGGR